MTRPFLPPSIDVLVEGEGTLAARALAEERISTAAFEAGHARGLAEGLARGRQDGIAAGRAEAERAAKDAATARERDGPKVVEAALAALLAARAEDRRAIDAEARAALAAALGVLAPTLLNGALGGELTVLIAEALESRGNGSDTVVLRATPETLAAYQQDDPKAPPEQLRLVPDPSMPAGSAEASWGSGGLLFDAESLTARAFAILGQTPASPPSSQEYAS